jgi:hypothetical protein
MAMQAVGAAILFAGGFAGGFGLRTAISWGRRHWLRRVRIARVTG